MWPGNQFQALFNFQRILCKKESEEASMLIIIYNVDTSNISRLLQIFDFPIEAVLNSFETQKGLELVFRKQFLQNFLMKLFLFEYDIHWSNFINRLCLLPQLFSEMYFLFYAQAFDDAIKFENTKILKFDFLQNEKSFQSKIKNIFPSLTSAFVQT